MHNGLKLIFSKQYIQVGSNLASKKIVVRYLKNTLLVQFVHWSISSDYRILELGLTEFCGDVQ